MIRYSKIILLSASILSLGACALSNPDGLPMPQMTFAEVQPLPINVKNLSVRPNEGSKPDDFIISPSNAAREYLAQRFSAAGKTGGLEAIIEVATVTKSHSASDNKVASYLNIAGTDNYNVTLAIRFQQLDDNGNVVHGKLLRARRLMRIDEHSSVADREKHEMEGMEALFHDLDKQVTPLVLDEMRLRM